MNSIISILQKKVKAGYNIGMNSPDYTPFWEETLRQIKQNLTETGRANDFVLWFNINYVDSQEGKIIASVASNYIRNEMKNRGYLTMIQETFYEISGLDMQLEVTIRDRNAEKPRSPITYHESTQDITLKKIFQQNVQTMPPQHDFKPKASFTEINPQYGYVEKAPQEEVIVTKKIHPELSEQYSFENFISSDENAYVYNAALAVSKNPGTAYNPLLIYGGVGLGKTHLMKAIGYSIFQSTNFKNIIYISAENFTNEFTQSIRDRSEKKFKDKYRNADVLLIDDIHFFEDKDKTQEELFHTFNALYDKQKQMVFTCDRPVSELKQITERLKSRFTRGVSADIHMPKYEVRSAIIQHKLEKQDKRLSPEVIDLIAKSIQSNVRDLEACLNSIILYSDITGGNLSLSQAKDIISKMFAQDTTQVTAEIIQRVVADYFNVSYTDIKGKKRHKNIAFARHIAVYLIHELTELSSTEIGHEFSGRDHTTIMHSCEVITKQLQIDESLNDTLSIIKKDIREYKKNSQTNLLIICQYTVENLRAFFHLWKLWKINKKRLPVIIILSYYIVMIQIVYSVFHNPYYYYYEFI